MPEWITGGQAATRTLVSHGVSAVFGVPGVQLDHLYNAIHDEGRPFDLYTARHEQGAGYMALGYAMASGRPGVLAVVPGPGLLNATAAIATAHGVSAPLVGLIGQVASGRIDLGRGQLHEIVDQPSITSGFTKHQSRATDPNDVSATVADALRAATEPAPGPALVELPPDVLAGDSRPAIESPQPALRRAVDAADLDRAVGLIDAAQRPLIVAGGGAVAAASSVAELARRIGAPVAMHRQGRGVLPHDDPLAVGLLDAHALWTDVDLVIVVGSRGQHLADWGVDDRLRQIWINADGRAPARMGCEPDVAFDVDASAVVGPLAERVAERGSRWPDLEDRRRAVAQSMAHLEPQLTYSRLIRDAVGPDGIVVNDLTQVGYVMRACHPVSAPRTLLQPGYMGTLGWSLPTAIGAKVANPDHPVVAITGDGGFGFTAMELATAVHYGIGVVTVVFDDSRFGNVQLMQRTVHGGRVHATDLTNPDWVAFARSFGARAIEVDDRPESLPDAIRAELETPGPSVIVVPQSDWPDPWPNLVLAPLRGISSPPSGGSPPGVRGVEAR